jgi:hypothetical protein
MWAGPRLRTGTAPAFIVMISSPPGQARRTLDDFLSGTVSSRMRLHKENWTQSNIEQGTINGLTFDLVRWSERKDHFAKPAHGFVYAAIDGPNYIELSGQDIEPNHEASLQIGETAARTFRKK